MRFNISTAQGGSFGMIGDPVDLPNNCGETFVLHYNPFSHYFFVDHEDEDALSAVECERFRVSHAGTGFRVSGGDTIDEAITRSIAKMSDAGEAGVRKVLDCAAAQLKEREGEKA